MITQQPLLAADGLPPMTVWEVEWNGFPVQVEYEFWLTQRGRKFVNGRLYQGPGASTRDGGVHKMPVGGGAANA